jgi:hypothetical protein
VSATKITNAPAAFSAIAGAINNHADLIKPLKAGQGICITESESNNLISINDATISSIAQRYGLGPRTFFSSVNDAGDVEVAPGVINNFTYAGETILASSLSDGDKIYIDATVTANTSTVTALDVSYAATVPSDSSTKAYTVIALVAKSGSVVTIAPLAWNYSQLQSCGGYIWGGFGI